MQSSSVGRFQIHWKMLLAKSALWLTAEVVLSLHGLDLIADNSEYLFYPRSMLAITVFGPRGLTANIPDGDVAYWRLLHSSQSVYRKAFRQGRTT